MPRPIPHDEAVAMGRKGGLKPNKKPRKEVLQRMAARQKLVARFEQEADKIFDGLMELAVGHWSVMDTVMGEQRVFRKSPEVAAIKELFDRMWGKAQQNVQIDGQIEHIANLEQAIKQIADGNSNNQFSSNALQERERRTIDLDPDAIRDIRDDIQEVLSENVSGCTYSMGQEFDSGFGDPDQSGDFSREMGDSGSKPTES